MAARFPHESERQESKTPPGGLDAVTPATALPYIYAELNQIREDQVRSDALARGSAMAAGRAEHSASVANGNVLAVAGQIHELRVFSHNSKLILGTGLENLNNQMKRRFALAEERARKRDQQQQATNEQLRVSMMGLQLAMAQDETERAELRAKIAAADAKADAATRRAEEAAEEAEEITDTYQVLRQPSQSEEIVLEMARMHAGLYNEKARAEIELRKQSAKTEIEVRAETRRAWVKTASAIALAMCGTGGLVWAVALKGCGG